MKVLVSVASRHGASFEIAEEISATLAASGFATAVLPPDAVTSLEGYDAVILGSSVYLGHWMDSAVEPRGALLDGDHGRTGLALLERSHRPRADAGGRAGRRGGSRRRHRAPASTASSPARSTAAGSGWARR